MRRAVYLSLVVSVWAALFSSNPAALEAQPPSAAATASDSLLQFVKAHAAITQLRDRAQADLANPRNKKGEAQAELRAKLREAIATAIREHGLTTEQFERMTHAVAVDPTWRDAFERELARVATKKPDG